MTAILTQTEAMLIELATRAHNEHPGAEIRLEITRRTDAGEYVDINIRTASRDRLALDIRNPFAPNESGPHIAISDVADASAGYFEGLRITSQTPAAVVEFETEKKADEPAAAEQPKTKHKQDPAIGWKPEE